MNWLTKAIKFGEKIKSFNCDKNLQKEIKQEIFKRFEFLLERGKLHSLIQSSFRSIYGYVARVANIIELVVDKGLIFFLEKIHIKY